MQAGLAAGEAVPAEFVDLVKPHVQSFDYFLGDGLTRVVELLEPIEVTSAPQVITISTYKQATAPSEHWVLCR